MKTRIIKQVVNSKGKITKASIVVKPFTPKYLVDASAEHVVTSISCLATYGWDNQSFTKESYQEAIDYVTDWREEYTRKHLRIRNLIIFILLFIIINLLSWR